MDGTKLDRHLDDVSKWQKKVSGFTHSYGIKFYKYLQIKCTFCYTAWAHGKTVMDPKVVKRLDYLNKENWNQKKVRL